jgi:hypothetical protein
MKPSLCLQALHAACSVYECEGQYVRQSTVHKHLYSVQCTVHTDVSQVGSERLKVMQ